MLGSVVGPEIGAAAFSGTQRTSTQTLTVTNTVTSVQQVLVTSRITSTIQLPGGTSLVEYAFSPGGNCAGVVIKWIGKANSTIHVMIYSFTLDNVRDALIQAKNRGVDVKVVMDREQAAGQGSEYATLKNAGIDLRLDSIRI